MGTCCADHVTPLYPQKLALTSPTGGGRSVGIVCVRTKATEFILKVRGLPSKFINIIKEGYEDFNCRVLHENQVSDSIKTSSGVRQGCLLSPLLFLLVMDGVLHRALDGKKRGLTWRLRESLEDLEYADDVCLVSHKYKHMHGKLDDLWKEPKKAGLVINSLNFWRQNYFF